MDSINKTDMALLDKEISNEAESELGPLKYLSGLTDTPMDVIINILLLTIIFVFDPFHQQIRQTISFHIFSREGPLWSPHRRVGGLMSGQGGRRI